MTRDLVKAEAISKEAQVTVGLVQSNLLEAPKRQTDHQQRVNDLLDLRRSVVEVARSDIERANEYGYKLIVSSAIVKKFRYAAGIGTRGMVRDYWDRWVQYAGDVPEFAIVLIKKALGITTDYGRTESLFRDMTIHSNHYLPVEHRGSIMAMVDPLVVGWLRVPHIVQRPWGFRAQNKVVGAVIAMWDMDKEIVIQ